MSIGQLPASTQRSSWQQGSMPYLFQTDPLWAQKPYAGATVALNGCGPTCLTMVYIYLTGNTDLTPADMCARADAGGYAPTGATEWRFMTEMPSKLGSPAENSNSRQTRYLRRSRQDSRSSAPWLLATSPRWATSSCFPASTMQACSRSTTPTAACGARRSGASTAFWARPPHAGPSPHSKQPRDAPSPLCGARAHQRKAGDPDMNRGRPPNRYAEPAQQPVRGALVHAGPEVPGIADLDRAQADIPHILALGFTGAIAFITLDKGNGDLASKIVALGNDVVASA